MLAHIGPIAVLFMGAALYGQARSYPYLGFVQTALGLAGVAAVIGLTKPLLPSVPRWAFILFFAGVAILNLMTWAIGGMALANDWI